MSPLTLLLSINIDNLVKCCFFDMLAYHLQSRVVSMIIKTLAITSTINGLTGEGMHTLRAVDFDFVDDRGYVRLNTSGFFR